jgi:hypothetical protein
LLKNWQYHAYYFCPNSHYLDFTSMASRHL